MADERVRVLRVIEIEYPDLEAYLNDADYWMLPGNGVKKLGNNVYRSTMMGPFEAFGEDVD